jgi:transposase-like protein
MPRALHEPEAHKTFVLEVAEVTNAMTTALGLEWDAKTVTDDHRQVVRGLSLSLPLCESYFGVVLDRLEVRVLGLEGTLVQSVQWALGLLPDGELEVLGAWQAVCDDTRRGKKLFADLKDRGVETVRFVIGSDTTMTRVDALAAFPRVKLLPSFEGLLRESLAQVAPSHRRALGDALRLLLAAGSLLSANGALDAVAATWEHRYPTLIGRWHRALEDLEPLYASSARQRHLLLLADELARDVHVRLRRALPREEVFHSSADVLLQVERSLSRVGHTLVRRRGVLRFGAAGHLSRRVDGRLAACS